MARDTTFHPQGKAAAKRDAAEFIDDLYWRSLTEGTLACYQIAGYILERIRNG